MHCPKVSKKAGIPLMSPGLLQHISLYKDALQVSITVISVCSGNKRIYKSNNYYDLQIALYHVQEDHESWGHFTVITKINALLSKSYYYDNCNMAFNNCKAHRYKDWCNICGRSQCTKIDEEITCTFCNAPCRSHECLNANQTKNQERLNPCVSR